MLCHLLSPPVLKASSTIKVSAKVKRNKLIQGLPRIEFNNLQEPLLLKLPDNTVGRLEFEFWVYALNKERNSEADRLIDIIVNQRSSFKFMFKYEVTKELYLQFEGFKSPFPLDYHTWWHISTSIDYITPS